MNNVQTWHTAKNWNLWASMPENLGGNSYCHVSCVCYIFFQPPVIPVTIESCRKSTQSLSTKELRLKVLIHTYRLTFVLPGELQFPSVFALKHTQVFRSFRYVSFMKNKLFQEPFLFFQYLLFVILLATCSEGMFTMTKVQIYLN